MEELIDTFANFMRLSSGLYELGDLRRVEGLSFNIYNVRSTGITGRYAATISHYSTVFIRMKEPTPLGNYEDIKLYKNEEGRVFLFVPKYHMVSIQRLHFSKCDIKKSEIETSTLQEIILAK